MLEIGLVVGRRIFEGRRVFSRSRLSLVGLVPGTETFKPQSCPDGRSEASETHFTYLGIWIQLPGLGAFHPFRLSDSFRDVNTLRRFVGHPSGSPGRLHPIRVSSGVPVRPQGPLSRGWWWVLDVKYPWSLGDPLLHGVVRIILTGLSSAGRRGSQPDPVYRGTFGCGSSPSPVSKTT